ncbi:LacI family DNA-binding transcriptional regulator [Neobacillus cucumis]|uniref:LacI family DNA-binding transcriptional regulator n=1 Tax=Neobacillus cucumis TaxID=1740721 RepID=UPI002E1BDFA2|nr:LacI family DNA-binding transcriptional regulator [Neobacillus cucumis]
MAPKPITLKEIAKLAGVSITTVSRVINQSNTKAASKEVQNKIWEIVRETNYIPNTAARNLKMQNFDSSETVTSRTIGCIFARSSANDINPFFSEIARSLEQEAFKLGYILKYSISSYDINNPNTYNFLKTNNVNGIAILGRYNKELLHFVKKHYKHVIYTGLNKPIDASYDQVICDGYQAAIAAVKYLYELGHNKIGYLGEIDNEVRYQGYCHAIETLGLPLKKGNIISTSFSSEGGYNAVKDFLKNENDITALFCGNDLTAIGAIKAIKESGLKVPDDISIIGVDNIDTAQYISPMLTTVHVPVEELGRMTAKILIDRIENGKNLAMKIELPFSIVVRESCRLIP